MNLEDLWRQLAEGHGTDVQTRVDGTHPCDIYADLQPGGRIGLVAICGAKPPDLRPLHAILMQRGRRTDGRWTLRVTLEDQRLTPVFAALCHDIVNCTRSEPDGHRLGEIVVQRLVHWRTLLDADSGGLGEMLLRGLIGELFVLGTRLLPQLGLQEGVAAWRGPLGGAQDFMLPDRSRLEVKMTGAYADQVRINGLGQLDAGGDPLTLVVVRVDDVAPGSSGAITAPMLVKGLREQMAEEPEALIAFDSALSALLWHEHPFHHAVAVRIIRVDDHEITTHFPRLTRSLVPQGVLDADYDVSLPRRLPVVGSIPRD